MEYHVLRISDLVVLSRKSENPNSDLKSMAESPISTLNCYGSLDLHLILATTFMGWRSYIGRLYHQKVQTAALRVSTQIFSSSP
jgi:hypothetical protein